MNLKQMEQIFLDTAYIRTSGSKEELQCAEYCLTLHSRESILIQTKRFALRTVSVSTA